MSEQTAFQKALGDARLAQTLEVVASRRDLILAAREPASGVRRVWPRPRQLRADDLFAAVEPLLLPGRYAVGCTYKTSLYRRGGAEPVVPRSPAPRDGSPLHLFVVRRFVRSVLDAVVDVRALAGAYQVDTSSPARLFAQAVGTADGGALLFADDWDLAVRVVGAEAVQDVRFWQKELSGVLDAPECMTELAYPGVLVEERVAGAAVSTIPAPDRRTVCLGVLGRMARTRTERFAGSKIVPSHGDLHANNLIVSAAERLVAIDWVSAGMHPFYWDPLYLAATADLQGTLSGVFDDHLAEIWAAAGENFSACELAYRLTEVDVERERLGLGPLPPSA